MRIILHMVKRIIFGLVVLIVTGVGIYFFFAPVHSDLSSAEKKKAIEKVLGRSIKTGQDVKTGNQTYNGTYLSFEYPAAAEEYPYDKEKILKLSYNLENFQFQQMASPKYFFNVNVRSGKGLSSIEDLTGVSLRENTPSIYQKSPINVDGEDAVMFSQKEGTTSLGGAEVSVFLEHDGKYFTFSISGSQLSDLIPIIEKVLASVTFK